MQYREIEPPSDLKHIIRFFWIARADAHPSESVAYRIVADGCPGIIFQKSNSRFAPEIKEESPLPNLFIYGQTTKHGILRSSGKAYTIGVNFYSYALKTIFGFDADEAMDELISMDAFDNYLYEKLNDADTTEGRIDHICDFIRKQMEKHAYKDSAIMHSILQIKKNRGDLQVYTLYNDLQISERQFQRRFKRQVGLTPKLFSRIIRFQSAFNQVHSQNYRQLSDVAFDNGYADQSHFIRDFKEFAGLSPGAYENPQVSLICQHREWNVAFG